MAKHREYYYVRWLNEETGIQNSEVSEEDPIDVMASLIEHGERHIILYSQRITIEQYLKLERKMG